MINHQNYDAIYEGYPQDPGKDGTNGIPVDKFSLELGYDVQSHIGITQNAARQYSGNISWLMWRTKDVNFSGYSLLGQTFSYDFNNRLLSSNFGYFSTTWQNTNSFDVSASYDQNGNISNITRYNNSAIQMDNLVYNYFPGYNRLQYVSDTQSSSYSTTDIDNQAANNYRYDDNGNMLQDLGNGIGFILYNIQNLPVSVYRTSSGQYNYHYDVNGQRILSTGSNNLTCGAFLSFILRIMQLKLRQYIQMIYSDTSIDDYFENGFVFRFNKFVTIYNSLQFKDTFIDTLLIRYDRLRRYAVIPFLVSLPFFIFYFIELA